MTTNGAQTRLLEGLNEDCAVTHRDELRLMLVRWP